jgi:hypothetical protein
MKNCEGMLLMPVNLGRAIEVLKRGLNWRCSDGVAGRLYHFVVAVWRLKAAQSDQREVLGSHR